MLNQNIKIEKVVRSYHVSNFKCLWQLFI